MLTRYLLCLCLALLTACNQPPEPKAENQLRISQPGDPESLDPRQVRDLGTATTLHMLYEGLLRMGPDGQPEPGIAESFTISNDQKTYTFFLRSSAWSDGTSLTAYDFERTWKSLLKPDFAAPNAYQLYVIQGAQAAKEGRIPTDRVGVQASDEKTLVVQLEHPIAYFPQLVATHFYYPVHPKIREGNLKEPAATSFVSNGPFRLERWNRNQELVVSKNPYYWDQEAVHLDEVHISIVDITTGLRLFENGELDWVGSPFSMLPIESLASLREEKLLHTAPSAGTHWFRFNTQKSPFDQPLIRRAFALALNRQDLVDHVLQGNQVPARQVTPPSFGIPHPFYEDHALSKAQRLFSEALAVQGISKQDFPAVHICYQANERNHKIAQAVQQQWKQAFNIDVALQSCEGKLSFDRLKKGDYQIMLGSWYADFRDPISFLEVFKSKDNGTNNTNWSNYTYMALLDQSSQQKDPQARLQLLHQAERILLEEMPIAPLYHNTYNYLQDPRVKDVYFSELGYLDFKKAKLEE